MLLIDPRAGSSDLIQPLKARGLPVEVAQLEAGDVAFIGNGPDGPIPIGVEYKRVGDAIKCMVDGRLAGRQLIALSESYTTYCLLLEGHVRCSVHDGSLQVLTLRGSWRSCTQGSRLIMYRDFMHWLLSMDLMAGLSIYRTLSLQESTCWLHAFYSWWTAKDWDGHKSHLVVYDGAGQSIAHGRATLTRPSLARRTAIQLPGVGVEKSRQVEAALPTLQHIALATENAWAQIPGIGKTLAKKIHAAIRGRNG